MHLMYKMQNLCTFTENPKNKHSTMEMSLITPNYCKPPTIVNLQMYISPCAFYKWNISPAEAIFVPNHDIP